MELWLRCKHVHKIYLNCKLTGTYNRVGFEGVPSADGTKYVYLIFYIWPGNPGKILYCTVPPNINLVYCTAPPNLNLVHCTVSSKPTPCLMSRQSRRLLQ